MSNITNTLIIAGAIFVALLAIGLIFSRLYTRSSKEVSFVRTGFGGQRVIMNGGALVRPGSSKRTIFACPPACASFGAVRPWRRFTSFISFRNEATLRTPSSPSVEQNL